MIDIHINIGSNSGHREALIERAVAAVVSAFPGAEVRRSEVMETPPWGFESPNPFLNVGVCIRIDNGCADGEAESVALRVLRKLQGIQAEIDSSPHRDAEGRYIDRAIDIDLIAIDDWVMRHPDLTLPHPRMHLRDFVLVPLMELAPEWRHPVIGKTPGEMLEELENGSA